MTEGNNFFLDLIASLQKPKSKKQIKTDVKSLRDIYVKLIGKLDLIKTRLSIKKQLKGFNFNSRSVTITPTINTKDIQNATKQAVNNAQKVANSNSIQLRFDTDKQKLLNQIRILGRNNSKLFNNSDMAAKYNQLLNSANIAKSKSELKALRGQLSAFKTELVATNNAGLTLGDKLKASISHYTQFFSGASFVYAMANQLRNAWTEAKTLDDRLVDLQKVTDEIADRDALYKYFDRAMSKAQDLNVKVDSLIYAITEFKKLGWSLSDAELGGEWATILENVGDVSIDTAIGSIKTAIASFDEIGGYTDVQMDKKLEAYIDLINNMSNKYSIDAEGLSEAIRLSAGTLTEAHTSIEQAATMFATANKYYNDPDYLGNTVKIGSLRMRASKGDGDAIAELEDMGEEVDNLAEATSSLREQLLSLTGVDIMVDEHTFKSYYDQLYEISQVIDDLDDTSRANVLETLFGKNRSAAGAAILSGLQDSAEAYKDAINSAGSATEEYEKWMQSADAAGQRFANNLTKTYQSLINGNTVRDLANIGSAVLEFANSFGIVEGTLKGILVLGVGKFFTTTTAAMISATKSVEQYGRALQLANNIPEGNLATRYSILKNIAVMTDTLTNAQLKQVLSSKALTQQDRIRILQLSGMTREMALQKLTEMGLTQATNAQTAANAASTASTFSLKVAMAGLGNTMRSVFLSNPVGIALMAVSVGVSAITSAISGHNQKMEEMRDKAKEAADEANTLGDEIADLTNKYISLSEAVKTDESAKEDLMSTQAELLNKLGLEGESIDDLIAKYGSLSNAIRQASIDSLKNSQIDLIAGVNVAREELLDVAKDNFWGTNNIIDAAGEDAVKAFNELEKAGVVSGDSYGTAGGAFVLIGDETVEGALENYRKLEDAVNALRDSEAFTAEELSENSLFQAIYGRYSEMQSGVEAYESAIGDLNENLSQQTMLTALQGREVPKTEEAFNSFRQELVNTAVASEQFIGNEKEITDAINNYLSTVPEFEGFYSIPLENELDEVNELLEQEAYSTVSTISSSVQQIATQLEPQFAKLGDAYSSIFSDDGFNLDVVDNSMLEGLRKSFAEIEEEIGVTFDPNKIDEFFDVISDSSHSAEETQQAFNDLATAYFYSTDTLEHLNEETAESIKQQLQQMGVVNNEEIVDHYLQLSEAETELIEIQNQLAEAQRDLAESSNTAEYESAKGRIDLAYKQIEAYYNEKGATDELRIALFNLQLQQANLDINSINTSSSVTQLLRLAESAGLTAEYMDKLVYLQQLFNQYQSATNSNMRSAIYSQIQSVKSQIASELEAPQLELEVDFPNGKDSGAGSAGKDAADEYMDGFNAEFDRLKFLRDNGIITEKEYLDQSRILYEKYFKDREEYLKEYVEHEREYLNGLKDLYEDVMGGITDLLDDQIDKIEEERDAKIDALEEEQEARTKALEQQKEQLDLQIEEIEAQIKGKNAAIDAINDEIDAIKEANDEKQRQLNLQNALLGQARAENQRTKLVYTESAGMVYKNDPNAIRNAKQAVDDAKTEIEIADKEKQISLIENEISLLESRKNLIGDQQEDLDKQLDALDEYYKKLIDNTEAYYSALIKPIEDYKAQFANIVDIEKSATFIEQLESLGYSVDDILSLNASSLENFKSNYLGILRDMYDDNTQMVDAIKQVSGLEGEFVGYLSQSQPYIDSLARLDLSSTQTAIDSANSGIHSFADGAELATVNITTMADTVTNLLEGNKKQAGIISRFEEMASVLADANNHIVGIGSAVEELDGKTATVTINIETNGDTSLLSMAHADGTVSKSFDASYNAQYGKAFADGTGEYKGLPKAEKNALVSEYGQEEMTILPNGKTIITDQPTMMDLPKGTVIFNEEQTKKIIDNKVDLSGNAHADGTDDSIWTTLSDGTKVRPLQPGDKMYDLVQKFDAYFKSIDGNLDKLVPNSFYEYNRQMNDVVNQITNSSIVNNNRNAQPVVNHINVTCPGVTSQQVAEQLGGVIGKELDKQFSGFHNYVDQQSRIR